MKIHFSSFQVFAIGFAKTILLCSFLAGYLYADLFPSNVETPISHVSSIKFDSQSELPDFSTYTDTKQKKSDFFSFLLPRIQSSNNAIQTERKNLMAINITQPLSDTNLAVIQKLAKKYKVKESEINTIYKQLLLRVDIIPASLVLSQAANESAWGTSRFALQANNLFGQWCYVKGCGIIPKQRNNSERHEVAKFSNIQKSIQSYMLNLNTQFSYADLRSIRASMRKKGKTVSGTTLANGLLKYSTRREAYVHEIQAMIRQNSLSQYDIR